MKKAQFFGGLLSAAYLYAVEESKPKKVRKPVRVKSLPKQHLWVCQGGPLDNVRISSKFEGAVTDRVGNKAAHGTGEPAEVIEFLSTPPYGAYLLEWHPDGKHTYVWKTIEELAAQSAPLAQSGGVEEQADSLRRPRGAPQGRAGSSPAPSRPKSLYEQMQERLGG